MGLISGPGEPSGPIERGDIVFVAVSTLLCDAGVGVAAPTAFSALEGETVNGDPTSDANGDLGVRSCVIWTPRRTGLVDSLAAIRATTLRRHKRKRNKSEEMN